MEQSQNSLERLKKSVDELIEVVHKQAANRFCPETAG